MNRTTLLLLVVVLALSAVARADGPARLLPGVPARASVTRLSRPLLTAARPERGALVLTVDQAAMTELKSATAPVLLESVPLAIGRGVNLEVERFRVTLPTTQFVVGQVAERHRIWPGAGRWKHCDFPSSQRRARRPAR